MGKSLWRKLMCAISRHRKLDVIQTFGAAQHLACRYCRREFAIHHGMRTFLPWDSEIAQLYIDMGYDVNAASRLYYVWREAFP